MQPLRTASDGNGLADTCAKETLSVIPSLMHFVRAQMRQNRQEELTVPQFRALIFVSIHEEASLSSMAEHVGLSLPAASRMVDLLVRRDLIRRRQQPNDRRCIRLTLTARGRSAHRAARRATQAALAHCFRSVPNNELKVLEKALALLTRTFTQTDIRMRNKA